MFHDWTLDCRTDGQGVTREHSMAYLKKLDIGYGYTADGGKTFPFRGKGIGLMPTLDEVLAGLSAGAAADQCKEPRPFRGREARGRAEQASRRTPGADHGLWRRRAGRDRASALPDIRTISRATIKSCLLGYIGYGWSGVVPKACRNAMVMLPINVAPWMWGWPDRFLNRMKAANSEVFVLGPYRGGEFSTGIDTPSSLRGCRKTIPAASGPMRSRRSPLTRSS